jgi:hypothetical protein
MEFQSRLWGLLHERFEVKLVYGFYRVTISASCPLHSYCYHLATRVERGGWEKLKFANIEELLDVEDLWPSRCDRDPMTDFPEAIERELKRKISLASPRIYSVEDHQALLDA